jgi:hypothetical protein
MAASANESIQQIRSRLAAANDAAEVFGPLHTIEELRRAYRQLAKTCHPDLHPADGEAAREAFVRLTRWHEIAWAQLRNGTYGQRPASVASPVIRLRHKKHEYEVQSTVAFGGDFANVHRAMHDLTPVAVKVARQACDNDLLIAERTALHRITGQVDARYRPFFPRLLDGFTYQDESSEPRATNVLSWVGGAYTLAEIRQEYETGLDPKDVAWIWRRLLVTLGAAHRTGIVHGAVLPPHVCVLPAAHGLVLIGWTCAVEVGRPIRAISLAYEPWHPKEVMTKEPATPATDIAMGAHCMLFLMREDAPAALSRFFRGCMLPSPRQRPPDAWALLREFDELLARLWGPRRFHPFAVSAPCPR